MAPGTPSARHAPHVHCLLRFAVWGSYFNPTVYAPTGSGRVPNEIMSNRTNLIDVTRWSQKGRTLPRTRKCIGCVLFTAHHVVVSPSLLHVGCSEAILSVLLVDSPLLSATCLRKGGLLLFPVRDFQGTLRPAQRAASGGGGGYLPTLGGRWPIKGEAALVGSLSRALGHSSSSSGRHLLRACC